MKKYAKVVNDQNMVMVGDGDISAVWQQNDDGTIQTVEDFYKSLGMELMEIEQGFDGARYLAGYAPVKPAPTVEETLKLYEEAVQEYLDITAQERGYDSTYTCLSYISSTDETWNREAHIFNAWRDSVWRKCHAVLDEFMEGKRSQPTVAELLAELPAIIW